MWHRDKNHPSDFANKQRLHNPLHLSPPPRLLPHQCLHFEKLFSLCPSHKSWPSRSRMRVLLQLLRFTLLVHLGVKEQRRLSARTECSSRSARKGRLYFYVPSAKCSEKQESFQTVTTLVCGSKILPLSPISFEIMKKLQHGKSFFFLEKKRHIYFKILMPDFCEDSRGSKCFELLFVIQTPNHHLKPSRTPLLLKEVWPWPDC